MRVADAVRVVRRSILPAGTITTRLGWVLALGSTFAFSFAPPVARAAIVSGFDSNALLMARMVIATALFGITLLVTDRTQLRLPAAGLRATALVGSINGLAMITFFLSLNYLEASLSAMLIALSPPLVLSLLALRGEKVTRRHLVRLALALIGVALLVHPTGQINWLGIGLAVFSTILFSVQMALTQWTLVGYPVRSVVFYITACMTCFVVAWWWRQGAVWVAPGATGWFFVVVLAVVSTYFARLGYYSAVGRLGSGQLALLGPLETLLSVTWAMIFLGERLSLLQLAGGVFILSSALLAIQRLGRVNLRLPRR